MDRLPQIIQDSDVVTISGSIPRGVSSDVYGKIISLAKGMGKKVILDSSGDTLKAGLRACPDMVKPNRDEMEQLFGEKLDSMEAVIACAEKIQAMGHSSCGRFPGRGRRPACVQGRLLPCRDPQAGSGEHRGLR